ncbi:MAG TPA: family 16 glycoside hydrolase, partial [Pirellulales bacterium]|nr:family 16 glycoside hydrolase [Pirellulales bacterium]
MNLLDTKCPPDSVLSDFGLGKLDAAQADTIGRHIETCADCRQRVAGISGDSFVGRLRHADAVQPKDRRERTYVPGESLANAGNSTDGSLEDGLPRPSRNVNEQAKQDGLGSPSSITGPPELVNHPDYELIKELGQGGMGTVYLAKNRMMDRLEVLKVISKALLDRPGALERFQQEIRSAAKLSHPNIVAAHSVLRPADLLVFAMEYVKGQDLSEVVGLRGPLPVANAAFYVHQVANGLQHAFEKGMVHRDIKPNNLMLAIDGKKHIVKILDFGLAKATSEKSAESGLTKSGQMLGTPDYVAPEQTLNAHQADIRADIYSLGCTFYFLLSGGPPFQEASLFEILKAHHEREPKPLNLVRPDVPVELATIVAKMMAKDPAKRYQTPIEVAKALVPFFKPGQAPAAPSPAKPRTEEEYPQFAMETAARPQATTPPAALGQPLPALPPSIGHPPTPLPVPVAPIATAPVPVTAATPPPAAKPVELLGLSIDTHRPAAKRRNGWSSLPPWQRWTALGGAAAALLLGVVLLVRTPHGTVEIAFSDTNAKVDVNIDGNHIDIAGLDKPLSLEVGEHQLKVKGDGYETITKEFTVTRGTNAPLTIKLVPDDPPTAIERTTEPETPAGGKKDVGPPGPALADSSLVPEGFVPLFNGKDLTGWKERSTSKGGWRVENGVLIGSGPAAAYLFTERGDFKDFHLRVEARIDDGANGGVFARTTNINRAIPDGYEAQIASTGEGKKKTGSLWAPDGALVPMAGSLVKPNEWFTLELIANDNHLLVKVNNQTTADYVDTRRRFAMGHIALEKFTRGKAVEFRKVEIKELQGASEKKPPVAFALDAEEFGGHRYKFYEVQLSWKSARDRCQSYGGRLLIIDSLAENEFVGGLVQKAGCHDAWIGITDEAEEGKWRSVDGELLHFTNWLAGNPNNKDGVEHFALMSNQTKQGTSIDWRWCDQPNESKQFQPGFVCEWEPAPTSSPSSLPPASASTTAAPSKAAPSTLPNAAKPDQWLPLFNGKDLTGWKTHPSQPGDWRVENSVLIGSGASTTYLYSDRDDWTDFHLRLEARVNSGGSAGVTCRAPFGPANPLGAKSNVLGYLAKINANSKGDKRKTGSLYVMRMQRNFADGNAVETSPAAPDEWFTMDILLEDNRVLIKVNGQTTTDYRDENRQFNRGGIALQVLNADTRVEFRKIEIRKLESAADAKPDGVPDDALGSGQPQPPLASNSSNGSTSAPASASASRPGDRPVAMVKRFDCQFDKRFRSDWSIEGDDLVQHSSRRSPSLTFGDSDRGDYDFSVEVKRVAGNGVCALGIGRTGENDAILLRLGVFGNGRYDVVSKRDGKPVNFGFRKGSLDQGRWYRAEVRVRGNKCECFLDGESLFAFTADSKITGPMSFASKSSSFRFRNIAIKSYDGKTLLEGLPDLDHARDQGGDDAMTDIA